MVICSWCKEPAEVVWLYPLELDLPIDGDDYDGYDQYDDGYEPEEVGDGELASDGRYGR
jgi:hypothetical protein